MKKINLIVKEIDKNFKQSFYDQVCHEIDTLEKRVEELNKILQDDDFIIENTVKNYSYCDADTGYNYVSDVVMSEEYEELYSEKKEKEKKLKNLYQLDHQICQLKL